MAGFSEPCHSSLISRLLVPMGVVAAPAPPSPQGLFPHAVDHGGITVLTTSSETPALRVWELSPRSGRVDWKAGESEV